MGFTARTIEIHLAKRQLRAVHCGVYAQGPLALTDRGRWFGAVLACGEGTLLSHWSAAALWGVLAEGSPRPHVTAPRNRHVRKGFLVHRAVAVHERDRARRDRIPVTSLARTLLDIAAISRGTAIARALEEADRLRLLRVAEVEELLARRRGQPGTRRLREVLTLHREPQASRSELEHRFLRVICEAGLPPPSVNVLVAGYLVDAYWSEAHLVVELDSWRYHRGRADFERDRSRDIALRIAGCEVLRVTDRQLRDSLEQTIAAIRTILARRSDSRWRARPPYGW